MVVKKAIEDELKHCHLQVPAGGACCCVHMVTVPMQGRSIT